MAFLLKANTRRTVQLRNDNAFSAIDDESSFVGHHRNGPHVDFFFFNPCFICQTELDLQGDVIGDPAADALFRRYLGTPKL